MCGYTQIDVAPQASSLLNEHLGFLRALLPEQPFGGLQVRLVSPSVPFLRPNIDG